MTIGSVCSEYQVSVPSLPKGAKITKDMKTIAKDVAILREMDWALSSLRELMDAFGQVGRLMGGLSPKGLKAYQETKKQLEKRSGISDPSPKSIAQEAIDRIKIEQYDGYGLDIELLELLIKTGDEAESIITGVSDQGKAKLGEAAAAIGVPDPSFELVAPKAISLIRSVQYKGYKADIALLTLLKGKVAEVEGPIRKELNSKTYPEATKSYDIIRNKDKKKLRPIIQAIIKALGLKLKSVKVDLSQIINGGTTAEKIDAARKQITQVIVGSCGTYSSSMPKPEPKVMPKLPKPEDKPILPGNGSVDEPQPLKFNLSGRLLPAYVTHWDADGERDDRAAMRYQGRAGIKFSPDSPLQQLQLDYSGQIAYNLFKPNAEGELQPITSEGFQDSYALSLKVPYDVVAQGAFVHERLGDKEQYMGTLGLAYQLKHFDGAAMFVPQIGGIAGSSEDGEVLGGGYAALNYSYLLKDPRIRFSGTGFYNILQRAEFDALGHQAGGSLALSWTPDPNLPVTLGLGAGVVANMGALDSIGVQVGPSIELNFMKMIDPDAEANALTPPIPRGGSF